MHPSHAPAAAGNGMSSPSSSGATHNEPARDRVELKFGMEGSALEIIAASGRTPYVLTRRELELHFSTYSVRLLAAEGLEGNIEKPLVRVDLLAANGCCLARKSSSKASRGCGVRAAWSRTHGNSVVSFAFPTSMAAANNEDLSLALHLVSPAGSIFKEVVLCSTQPIPLRTIEQNRGAPQTMVLDKGGVIQVIFEHFVGGESKFTPAFEGAVGDEEEDGDEELKSSNANRESLSTTGEFHTDSESSSSSGYDSGDELCHGGEDLWGKGDSTELWGAAGECGQLYVSGSESASSKSSNFFPQGGTSSGAGSQFVLHSYVWSSDERSGGNNNPFYLSTASSDCSSVFTRLDGWSSGHDSCFGERMAAPSVRHCRT